MKYFCCVSLFILLVACRSTNAIVDNSEVDSKPVTIKNDDLEYEIIIIDNGYDTYLNSIAKPITFYTKEYCRAKNIYYVNEWNARVRNPLRYGYIFQQEIDYNSSIDYGLEVNYKLYNYFKFVEYKYKINFGISNF